MSIEDINQYKEDRLMVNGEWVPDTMTCVLYSMENRHLVYSFSNPMIEELAEYKRLVEIGCEYARETKNATAAQELDDALAEDAKIVWISLGIQGCTLLYSIHNLFVIDMLWKYTMMAKTIIDQIETATRI